MTLRLSTDQLCTQARSETQNNYSNVVAVHSSLAN